MNAGVTRVFAIALSGIEGTEIAVEAAVSNQLPGMAIVGLPDTALAEAKQRVKLAVQHSGLKLSDRFIVINLSPAALPKHGSGFDLAIALAALAASGSIPSNQHEHVAHIGELALDGELRRPAGFLTSVIAAQQLGFRSVMVPRSCEAEARLVSQIEVIAVGTLREAAAHHRHEHSEPEVRTVTTVRDRPSRPTHERDTEDLSDVIGQPEAVEALIIAAAGKHHIAMVGPPGSGKTMLASRLVSLLPDLDSNESLVASSIASLCGESLTQLVRRPPFVSPHHTATKVSMIGSGDARGVRPGAITRASHGVLFLDEAPEFPRSVLDALRQPLESGFVEIHRAHMNTTMPANMQLVIAANPCPCGNADSVDLAQPCTCSPATQRRYFARLSGPLSDRIDIRLKVRKVATAMLSEETPGTITSAEARSLVIQARQRAAARLKQTPWQVNAQVSGSWMRAPENRLPRAVTAVLDAAHARGALTLRGYERVLRVAWTIADLAAKPQPEREDVQKALLFREVY